MNESHALFDVIDRTVCLDIGGRGVAGLFDAARARHEEPLSRAAARLLEGLRPGEVVMILTGSMTRATITPQMAENDGPFGVAALARAITLGFNAIPVVLTDQPIAGKIARAIELAGPTVVTIDQARKAVETPRYTAVATVMSGSIEDAEARHLAERWFEALQPKAVVSVERAGLAADGTYRNMLGQDYSEGRERLDHVMDVAAERGVPTLGIGDGGNEIGMGAVREAVLEHIPHGEALCAEFASDVLMPCGVSNWGCYALAAALAIVKGDARLSHAPDTERRLIESGPLIGLVDATKGLLQPTVDGLPLGVHVGVAEILQDIANRAIAAGVKG